MRSVLVAVLVTFVGCCLLDLTSARGPLSAQFPQTDGHVLDTGGDPGSPLYLTPYLQKGQIKTARHLAEVRGLKTSAESYSGFLTVNSTYNSNMFFWLCLAESKDEDTPLLLWLQGGPGGSSLFGLFVENGPFGIDKNLNMFERKFAWTKAYNVLYIDNPVMTGFSFTQDDQGFATNEYDVGENLYRAMVQIYQMFPEFRKNDFYLTGESYAGKYIPALAHRIHNDPSSTIPLKGAAIGDGFSDPPLMIHAYAPFMYEIGMLDENQAAYFQKQMDHITELITAQKYEEAFKKINEAYAQSSNVSGLQDMYNYLRTEAPADYDYYAKFLELPEVRKAIHVGNLTYNSGESVEKHIVNDIMQSIKPWLAELMDNYRVMLYSGQLDIIVALPLTQAMLQTVPWSGLSLYKQAERHVWRVNPSDVNVAGYVRQVKDFYQVMVRGGGHILPYDQPERSFDMIHRFVSKKPFW